MARRCVRHPHTPTIPLPHSNHNPTGSLSGYRLYLEAGRLNYPCQAPLHPCPSITRPTHLAQTSHVAITPAGVLLGTRIASTSPSRHHLPRHQILPRRPRSTTKPYHTHINIKSTKHYCHTPTVSWLPTCRDSPAQPPGPPTPPPPQCARAVYQHGCSAVQSAQCTQQCLRS